MNRFIKNVLLAAAVLGLWACPLRPQAMHRSATVSALSIPDPVVPQPAMRRTMTMSSVDLPGPVTPVSPALSVGPVKSPVAPVQKYKPIGPPAAGPLAFPPALRSSDVGMAPKVARPVAPIDVDEPDFFAPDAKVPAMSSARAAAWDQLFEAPSPAVAVSSVTPEMTRLTPRAAQGRRVGQRMLEQLYSPESTPEQRKFAGIALRAMLRKEGVLDVFPESPSPGYPSRPTRPMTAEIGVQAGPLRRPSVPEAGVQEGMLPDLFAEPRPAAGVQEGMLPDLFAEPRPAAGVQEGMLPDLFAEPRPEAGVQEGMLPDLFAEPRPEAGVQEGMLPDLFAEPRPEAGVQEGMLPALFAEPRPEAGVQEGMLPDLFAEQRPEAGVQEGMLPGLFAEPRPEAGVQEGMLPDLFAETPEARILGAEARPGMQAVTGQVRVEPEAVPVPRPQLDLTGVGDGLVPPLQPGVPTRRLPKLGRAGKAGLALAGVGAAALAADELTEDEGTDVTVNVQQETAVGASATADAGALALQAESQAEDTQAAGEQVPDEPLIEEVEWLGF